MKHKFTTTTFLVLAVLFAIGQNTDFRTFEKLAKPIRERHLMESDPDGDFIGAETLFQINRNIALKSSQTTKQRLDSSVFRAWNDTTKLWTNYSKRVNTYDNNEKNTQSIGYAWIGATGTWIPDWKSEISYNENQNASQYITYDWDKATGQWIPDWKEIFSYNSEGTMPQILQHYWDTKTSQWVLSWQSIYSYNAYRHLTQILDYYQDETTLKWVLAWKYLYSFDANGNQTQQLEYFMDDKTSDWVADSKIEYIYDENENVSEYQVFNRNQVTGQLELDWKRDYTYDNNYSFNDLITPFIYLWQVNFYNHKITDQSTSMWNKSTNAWDRPIYYSTFYYSELNTTSVSSLGLKLAEIYPNPASKQINFHFTGIDNQAKFELYDLQGKKVMTENVLNGGKLEVWQLNKGVYFYNIITNKNRQSGKLIKQ
jgi:hypothetical protein